MCMLHGNFTSRLTLIILILTLWAYIIYNSYSYYITFKYVIHVYHIRMFVISFQYANAFTEYADGLCAYPPVCLRLTSLLSCSGYCVECCCCVFEIGISSHRNLLPASFSSFLRACLIARIINSLSRRLLNLRSSSNFGYLLILFLLYYPYNCKCYASFHSRLNHS